MGDMSNPLHFIDPLLDDAKVAWDDLSGTTARKDAEKAAKRQAEEAARIQREADASLKDEEFRKRAAVLAGVGRRGTGRASTILTGSQGLTTDATTASATLMGK